MNIVVEPQVYLIGRQFVLHDEVGRFLSDHGIENWSTNTASPAETLSEIGGRLCYMSFEKPRPGGNRAYLERILSSGHGSVLEHQVWTMIFTGVSRTLTHELVRHRAGIGYSQLSQRYVDSSDVAFVVPVELLEDVAEARDWLLRYNAVYADASRMLNWLDENGNPTGAALGMYYKPSELAFSGLRWLATMCSARTAYAVLTAELTTRLLDGRDQNTLGRDERTELRKAARQAARSVLPGCTETKIQVTANARTWRHLIEMRCSGPAEKEIRRLFAKVHGILVAEAPNTFGDYLKQPLKDGSYALTTPWRKV